jgi:hypothetical protein
MFSPSDYDSVISELKEKGCMCVVLACTELSVIWNGINDEYIVDSLLTLARRAIVYVWVKRLRTNIIFLIYMIEKHYYQKWYHLIIVDSILEWS